MTIYTSDSFLRTFESREILIHSRQLDVKVEKLLPYLNPAEFNSYCKEGCPNYSQKWTCPPHCPGFQEYADGYTHLSLYLFHTSPAQFHFLKEEERSLEAYNFIKEELQAYLRDIELPQEKMVAANSCEICKDCALTKNKPCHIPDRIRYNLVAFGFNVGKIMTELFDHDLQWAGNGQIPEYVSSVGAILKK